VGGGRFEKRGGRPRGRTAQKNQKAHAHRTVSDEIAIGNWFPIRVEDGPYASFAD